MNGLLALGLQVSVGLVVDILKSILNFFYRFKVICLFFLYFQHILMGVTTMETVTDMVEDRISTLAVVIQVCTICFE